MELKLLYSDMNAKTEAKVISEMKENPKAFFSYARSRQKVKAKIGPFMDEETGDIDLDPAYTVECLSQQYSSVFSQPRPEWSIPSISEFFRVNSGGPTGPLLTDIEFTEEDIENACS